MQARLRAAQEAKEATELARHNQIRADECYNRAVGATVMKDYADAESALYLPLYCCVTIGAI